MSDQSSAPSPRLFVGNLAWATTDDTLRNAFVSDSRHPLEAKVIVDRYSGRSRGFGFVTFESIDDATSAMNDMQGVEVDGRNIRVDFAASHRN